MAIKGREGTKDLEGQVIQEVWVVQEDLDNTITPLGMILTIQMDGIVMLKRNTLLPIMVTCSHTC